MIYCGPEILQFASGRSVGRPLGNIFPAQAPVDLGKRLVAEKSKKLSDALCGFCRPRMATCDVTSVKSEHVRDRHLKWCTGALYRRFAKVLLGDIGCECLLSSATIINAAACAL